MNISFYLPFVSCNGTTTPTLTTALTPTREALRPPGLTAAYATPYASADLFHLSTQGLDGMALYGYLLQQHHTVHIASRFCSRFSYLRPWAYARLAGERKQALACRHESPSHIWLSCHCSEIAPDMLGSHCSRQLSIPYVIYKPVLDHGRSLRVRTLPGFFLNRCSLRAADLVFTDRKTEAQHLLRTLPAQRVHYLKPRVIPDHFPFDLVARRALREHWSVGDRRIVMTTAMLRPGAKTIGVRKVIESCRQLRQRGLETLLVIAGDGLDRTLLEREAREKLCDNVIFIGKIPRHDLYRYYSAADVFAFPGIQETRGLVFLEAQAAGLPVVAFADWSASDTVVHESTGLLAPASQPECFTVYLEQILTNREQRITMREAAKDHVHRNHHAAEGYRLVQQAMQDMVARSNQRYI